MDPLLTCIEASSRAGEYAVTVILPDGGERALVMTVNDDSVQLPAAAGVDGWSPDSESFRAVTEAVLAVDRARRVGTPAVRLLDVPGGWDVGLGNVVLSSTGTPECVAHGELQAAEGGRWECAECGAAALFGG